MVIFHSYVKLPEGICTNFAIDLTGAPTLNAKKLCQETAFDRRAKFPQIGERSSTPTGDRSDHEGMLVFLTTDVGSIDIFAIIFHGVT